MRTTPMAVMTNAFKRALRLRAPSEFERVAAYGVGHAVAAAASAAQMPVSKSSSSQSQFGADDGDHFDAFLVE